MASHGARTVWRSAAVLFCAALAATCGANLPSRTPPWDSPGLIGSGGWPYATTPLDPEVAAGGSYIPGTSVLRLRDGGVRFVPLGADRPITVPAGDPRAGEAVAGDRDWLAAGRVPGTTPAERAMAGRALLDLRLLTRPNGATTASWYQSWNYVWPRDAAFAAAAFAVTGHTAEARRVLRFLASVQEDSGLWAARYGPDGTAVTDGRRVQLDGLGWVLWASWFFQAAAPAGAAELPELWPMVRRAADRLAAVLDADGLPPPSSDYWERDPSAEQDPRRPTLGVAAPVLTGLRGAAAIATGRGRAGARESRRWHVAARRLAAAVDRVFAPYGYPRSPLPNGNMDASPTFLAPPFAPADPRVTAAVRVAADRLRLPNGGVLPGDNWPGDRTVAWTPEVAMFALAEAARGDIDGARARLDWLAAHRTTLGALPEKVDGRGRPVSVAPLGWTAALVTLAQSAAEAPLPIPPP
ncbi:MAG TPA: glycoside hydrolase family 15 protein [Streptosporangiaceae bacterium]|nr:glycoside hydrolase family 15 protein [Streptosporangiaceae bacterium]